MKNLPLGLALLLLIGTATGQTPDPLTPDREEAIRNLQDQLQILNQVVLTTNPSKPNYIYVQESIFMEEEEISLIKGGYSTAKAAKIALVEVCIRALDRNPNDPNIHSSMADLQTELNQLKTGPKE